MPVSSAKANFYCICSRLLMHTIRHHTPRKSIYELVKLCLRYTARDPRLRIDVWTENSHNISGELTGGHGESIFNFSNLATASRKKPSQQIVIRRSVFEKNRRQCGVV